MASEQNRLLQRVLAPLLKAGGFTKEGATWRKRFLESIAVFNIQGSQWGLSFYINLGVYFIALGHKERPLEYHCHVRARLDSVVRDRSRCHELLDFEHPLPDRERFGELGALVSEAAVPWLERVATPAGAKAYSAQLPARTPWVTRECKEYLGL